MNVVIHDSTLLLKPSQTIELVDAVGVVAAIDRGSLWVTMDGDRRDIVLNAGDRWVVERNGRTLIQAQSESAVRLAAYRPPSLSWSVGRRIRQAWAVLVAHFPSLRRPVPYY